MSGAFESTLLSPVGTRNKMFMETGFLVNGGHDGYNNVESVISDGATSNRAQIQGPFDAVNNPRGWVAGAATLTWRGTVTVPTIAWGGVGHLYLTSSSSAPAAINTLAITSTGAADLTITQNGGIFNTDFRRFIWSAFRTTYSGQTITLELIFTQGTANPVVRVNEVDISASFTLTTGGTPPEWLDASMVPTYHLTGYNWPSGPAPVGCWILGSLTDADRAFHRSTGQYPAWVVIGGSAGFVLSTIADGATLGDAPFTTLSGISSTGFTAGAKAGTAYAKGGVVINVVAGQRVGVVVTCSSTSGAPSIQLSRSGITQGASNTAALSVGTATYYLTSTYTGTVVILFSANGTSGFVISGFAPFVEGALSLPGIQPCAVVDDLTTIGGNGARLLGMDTRSSSNKKVLRISDLTHTSGNEQILGGSVFYGTSEDLITRWTIFNAGGTTTVSIGNVSGGTQYANAVSCPTGTTVITLLTAIPLTPNLWVNANTTAVLTHFIEGKRTV